MPVARALVSRLALAGLALAALPAPVLAQGAVAFGGTSADVGYAVAVDARDNAVVTGSFTGTADFSPGAGVTSRTSAGGNDVFVARYAPDGSLFSVVTFGSTGSEVGLGVAVAPNNDAVVTGSFQGTVDFDPGPAVVSRTSAGSSDVFVARYDASGALVSVLAFGGTGSDVGYAVAVDAGGEAVVAGQFEGTVDFNPGAGIAGRASAGAQDVFVARYDASGALVSAVGFGGATHDSGSGVAVDASGNAVVTGHFQGTADFDPGAGVDSRTSVANSDAFVARYTPGGALLNVVALFGAANTNGSNGRDVAVDAAGNAVVTGTFSNTVDFNPGLDVENRTSVGGYAVFVARYTPGGAFAGVVTFGGSTFNEGTGVAVDASGNAVVTGYFGGTVDFDPGTGTVSRTGTGPVDAFVVRYTPAGAFVGVAAFGAAGDDRGHGVALDAKGNAVATGQFENTVDFNPGPGVANRTSAGSQDAFVVRYLPSTGVAAERSPVAAGASGLVALGQRAVRLDLAGADASLRVRLYDVLGREVARLFDGSTAAGRLELRVPDGLAPGTYLVHASGASVRATTTLVVR